MRNICDFGAIVGSDRLQTQAIQSAINACEVAGGGTVLIPSGRFRSGTLKLCSNLVLYLEAGAILEASGKIDDYEAFPFPWELYPVTRSLLYAKDCHNISISGRGVIDFNAKAFVIWDKLLTGADRQVPDELRKDMHYEMPPREGRPNRLIFFMNCRNIDIHGISLVDSPTWTLVFHRSSKIRIRDVIMDNHRQVPNNDCVHCCGSNDMIISGCFMSAGDDCIALTSISDAAAICENILISDCVFCSSSAALRIGFKDGKVRNVRIRNCIIRDSNRGIAVFAGKNGFVRDLDIDGLTLECRIFAGPWWGKGEPLVFSATGGGAIANVTLANATIKAENSILIINRDSTIKGIILRNLSIAISYGKARPWFGNEYDCSPDPALDSPQPEHHIPWLYVECSDVRHAEVVVKKDIDEAHSFSTEAIIRGTL